MAGDHANGNGRLHVNGNNHVLPADDQSTETSPLLKKNLGASKPLDSSLGALPDAPIENGALNGNGEAGAVEETENPMFEGLPEVMAKMHWIMPAIAVGVS